MARYPRRLRLRAPAGITFEVCDLDCNQLVQHASSRVLLLEVGDDDPARETDCRHCVMCGDLIWSPTRCDLHAVCPETTVLATVPVRQALQLWRQRHGTPYPDHPEAWDTLETHALLMHELGRSSFTAAGILLDLDPHDHV